MTLPTDRLTCVVSDGEPSFFCAGAPSVAGAAIAHFLVLAAETAPELAFDLTCEALRRRLGCGGADNLPGRARLALIA